MSEPIVERLSRFTPDAGGLDRDALLFAAGRGSIRPNRGWIGLATVLAGTQVLSLALLWLHWTPPAAGLAMPVASLPAPSGSLQLPISEGSLSPRLWSAHSDLLKAETENGAPDEATLIETGPPLRAFAPPPSILY